MCRKGKTQALQDALIDKGVPFHVNRQKPFLEREAVRDSMALLDLTSNPHSDVAFERMLNKPTRGLGESRANRSD